MTRASGGECSYSLVYHALSERELHGLLETLDAIRGLLGIDPIADRRGSWRAHALIENAVREGRYIYIDDVLAMLRGRAVIVLCSGVCLEEQLENLELQGVLVAADGATTLLLEVVGVCPHIIVTDFDGILEDILFCSRMGSVIVAHVHGDNVWVAEDILPSLPKFTVTVQTPNPPPHTTLLPGFTDGDRAVWLAVLARPRSVRLLGFCPGKPQHPATERLPGDNVKLTLAQFFVRRALYWRLVKARESSGL